MTVSLGTSFGGNKEDLTSLLEQYRETLETLYSIKSFIEQKPEFYTEQISLMQGIQQVCDFLSALYDNTIEVSERTNDELALQFLYNSLVVSTVTLNPVICNMIQNMNNSADLRLADLYEEIKKLKESQEENLHKIQLLQYEEDINELISLKLLQKKAQLESDIDSLKSSLKETVESIEVLELQLGSPDDDSFQYGVVNPRLTDQNQSHRQRYQIMYHQECIGVFISSIFISIFLYFVLNSVF